MRKAVGGAIGLAAAIAALALWRCRGNDSGGEATTTETASSAPAHAGASRRPDPRTLAPALIAGTVTDDANAPIAHARVCADGTSPDLPDDLLHDPSCTETDTAGHYVIQELFPASYTVAAMAPSFRPGWYHADDDHLALHLAAGAHVTGIDIMLPHGGVLLSGTVADVSGGPISHAHVSTSGRSSHVPGVMVETDDAGRFSLWTAPTWVVVVAGADGYADAWEQTAAPGSVAIQLTPEASLAGTVVNAATGEPSEGVHVNVAGGGGTATTHGGFDISDAQGRFHVHRLGPGRYTATARASTAYGRSEGSALLGLGQHLNGVVVRMFPAAQITGRVVIASSREPCPEAHVSLHDARDHYLDGVAGSDGAVRFEAVLPTEYRVDVECRDHVARDSYDRVVVADKDLSGLEWTVEPGATIRGRVTNGAGEAVADAEVYTYLDNPEGHSRSKTARTARDGRYALRGLVAGRYRITANSVDGVSPGSGVAVEVAALAVAEKDLVLDGVGAIDGVVVDRDGTPVAGLLVLAKNSASARIPAWSAADGTFHLPGLRAGDYRLLAGEPDRIDELPGVPATVKPPGSATVRLTIDAKLGSIRGSVVDADGKPVGDAYVEADPDGAGAQVTMRAGWAEKRVLAGTDGTFTLTVTGAMYTLRAYRRGGGEAIREHVPVGTTTTLELRRTGSIAGTAGDRSGRAADDFTLRVIDPRAGLVRSEEIVHTGGRFVIHDLPAGHYSITATAPNGYATRDVVLGEGEAKTGVNLDLATLITLTGRVVELGTSKPVPQLRMMVLATGYHDRNLENITTGDDGRFTVPGVPVGAVDIGGWVSEGKRVTLWLDTARTLSGTGTIDVGDLVAVPARSQRGDAVGVLGVVFEDPTPPEQRSFKVRTIDPNGPAAKTSLRVGDVIANIDGADVTGGNYNTGHALLRAPPGTALKLGLARGETVTVVLAAPP